MLLVMLVEQTDEPTRTYDTTASEVEETRVGPKPTLARCGKVIPFERKRVSGGAA
jgi:hypothetical protein